MPVMTSTFDGDKIGWNWEKYFSYHIKCNKNLENLKDYGHNGLDTMAKVHYLLNGIRCNKLTNLIALAHKKQVQKGY